METTAYFAGSHRYDRELHRLRRLEAVHDPASLRQLDAVGPITGWRCLEMGAGAGSLARELAGRVGPYGTVTAADVDPRFLDAGLPDVIEVIRHDVLAGPVAHAAFDLVHARAVLMHLADPARALAHLAAAVRPGGWLIVEDLDVTTLVADDPAHPAAPVVDRTWRALTAAVSRAGVMVTDFGRRLPALLADLGFAQTHHEAPVRVVRGGGTAAEVNITSADLARRAAGGAVPDADFAALVAALRDPGFTFVDTTMHACRVRRASGAEGS